FVNADHLFSFIVRVLRESLNKDHKQLWVTKPPVAADESPVTAERSLPSESFRPLVQNMNEASPSPHPHPHPHEAPALVLNRSTKRDSQQPSLSTLQDKVTQSGALFEEQVEYEF